MSRRRSADHGTVRQNRYGRATHLAWVTLCSRCRADILPADHEWTLLPGLDWSRHASPDTLRSRVHSPRRGGCSGAVLGAALATEDAVVNSVFAGMVATSVAMVFGRSPI